VGKSELVDLIPLYVTGKVSDKQKAAIERELPNSKELRDEIAFWKAARVTTQREAAYLLAGHLTSERIVDYARGAILIPMEKTEIERHLQACDSCSNELETIRPSYVPPIPVLLPVLFPRLIHGLTTTMRSVGRLLIPGAGVGSGFAAILKPIYAFPLIALLVASGVVIYQMTNPRVYPFSFALQFQAEQRAASESAIQRLIIPRKISVLHLSIPIPHATLQPYVRNITLILSTPHEKGIHLNQKLSWSVGNPFDSAKVEVDASLLQTPGMYFLLANVKYTLTSEPFEYSYRFEVTPEQ